jgi:hypothetical protein
MMQRNIGALLLLCVGCASEGPLTLNKANPCATPNATYLTHFVEVSGDCGPSSDQLVNIKPDGTLDQTFSCLDITKVGCREQNDLCTFTSNGVTCTATTDVTFTSDGKSSSGIESVTCHNAGTICSSTYNVSAERLCQATSGSAVYVHCQ